MSVGTFMAILLCHLLFRSGFTSYVTSRSRLRDGARYLGGRRTIILLWVGYIYLLGMSVAQATKEGVVLRIAIAYGIFVCGTILRSVALVAIREYYFAAIWTVRNHRVIRSGPYRVLRHPLYFGLAIELVGLGIIAWTVESGAVLGFVVLAIVRQVKKEERLLRGVLGAPYAEHCEATWDLSDIAALQKLLWSAEGALAIVRRAGIWLATPVWFRPRTMNEATLPVSSRVAPQKGFRKST